MCLVQTAVEKTELDHNGDGLSKITVKDGYVI